MPNFQDTFETRKRAFSICITVPLKVEFKNLPQTDFLDQDDGWVKSDKVLNENFDCKDFLQLVETGNEKFSKSISLFLKHFFTSTTIIIVIILCPSALSLLSPLLSSTSLLSALVSPPLSSLGPSSALLPLSSPALSLLQSTLLLSSLQFTSLQLLSSTSPSSLLSPTALSKSSQQANLISPSPQLASS